ncbi:hypothetical protein JX265_011111 [Neoarthrinium moseri]|uniref:FAD-binding domain-containing protein n=1 Tax=Neoarthrinium moseri TaxID=1658444 RepID=A0A9Q0AHV9_9PEZI|nr:uncharacterized protein JN550_005092 [Neoarthrinium moseri]KAI1852477.1 hypothetical protein JX266_002655 [Neoarthrinium moseri]KAI1857696.1 hypothetical protein JX265_011111 [Neoarthrinium moseri]KAI1870549.1 hypothetical protein JN550_005092 [Neoarthrinium moseri]
MRIIIVGAGLGGLSAAICFARKGHDVEVLEQRDSISPAGSGINIRPPASKIMHTWGLRPDLERISVDTAGNCFRSLQTGAVATKTVATDVADDPDWGTMRSVVIKVLERRAAEAGATLTFNSTVVTAEDEEAGPVLILENGSRMQADLVLASDGIRSGIRAQILRDIQDPVEPLLSDITLYGVQLGKNEMDGVKEFEQLIGSPYLNVYMGNESFVVSRYTPNLETHGCLFGIKGQTDQKALWDEKGDIDYIRRFFRGSCPEMRKVLRLCTTCDRWRLAELPDLPRWTSRNGRIVLLGDSAHAMHPNAAQGFSQIVEDIGVLEFLISQDAHASINMRTITGDWERIRKPRVERIKKWARTNSDIFIGQPVTGTKQADNWHIKSLKNTKPDMNAHFNSSAFLKWAQCYDAIGEVS